MTSTSTPATTAPRLAAQAPPTARVQPPWVRWAQLALGASLVSGSLSNTVVGRLGILATSGFYVWPCLGALACGLRWPRRVRLRPALGAALVLVVGAALLSPATTPYSANLCTALLVKAVPILLATNVLIRSRAELDRLVGGIVAVALLSTFLGLVELVAGTDLGARGAGRAGHLMNPIAVGRYASVAMLALLVAAWSSSGHRRILLLLSSVGAAMVLLAAESRGPALSTAVAVFVLLVWNRRVRQVAPAALGAVSLGILLLGGLTVAQEHSEARIFATDTGGEATRFHLWQVAVDKGIHNPVLPEAGRLAHDMSFVTPYPHNIVAETFSDYGVLGLVLFGLGAALAISRLAARYKTSPTRRSALNLAVFASLGAGALFSGNIIDNLPLLGIIVGQTSLGALPDPPAPTSGPATRVRA